MVTILRDLASRALRRCFLEVRSWRCHTQRTPAGEIDRPCRFSISETRTWPQAGCSIESSTSARSRCFSIWEDSTNHNYLRSGHKAGSPVYIATPDLGHRAVPHNIAAWDMVYPPEHLQSFNRKNLELLFATKRLCLDACIQKAGSGALSTILATVCLALDCSSVRTSLARSPRGKGAATLGALRMPRTRRGDLIKAKLDAPENRRLPLAAPPEYVMLVRPNALRRCIGNLIGKPRRHGSHVSLTGVVVADGIDILADDDGLGITIIRPADRDHAFSAFVRLDSQPIDPEGSAWA